MANFLIYTYMFKPVTTSYAGDLFDNSEVDVKESLAHKQELLSGLFPKDAGLGKFDKGEDDGLRFVYNDEVFLHKMVMNEGGVIVFRIANNKKVMHHRADFTDEEFEDHPNCLVIIDNRKDRQIVAVEQKKMVFGEKMVANILAETFNALLARYRLTLTIDAKYHKSEFWRVVSSYPNGIKRVTFAFPYPNLPKITELVSESMKRLALETKCEPTQVLNALDGQVLNLDKDSRMLLDMIAACAASGKPIMMLPVGKRSVLKCNTDKSLVREDLDNNVIKGLMNKDFFNTWVESVTEFLNRIKLVYD